MTSKTKLSEITDYLPAFISKMESEGLPPLVIDTYAYYNQMVVKGESGLVYDSDIKPVGPDEVEDFNKLKAYAKAAVNALNQTVHIVLNGDDHGIRVEIPNHVPRLIIDIYPGKTAA